MSKSYEILITRNPKGTDAHSGIQMQLGEGDIQLSTNVHPKLFKRDNKVKSRKEGGVHIHEMSLSQVSTHEDALIREKILPNSVNNIPLHA